MYHPEKRKRDGPRRQQHPHIDSLLGCCGLARPQHQQTEPFHGKTWPDLSPGSTNHDAAEALFPMTRTEKSMPPRSFPGGTHCERVSGSHATLSPRGTLHHTKSGPGLNLDKEIMQCGGMGCVQSFGAYCPRETWSGREPSRPRMWYPTHGLWLTCHPGLDKPWAFAACDRVPPRPLHVGAEVHIPGNCGVGPTGKQAPSGIPFARSTILGIEDCRGIWGPGRPSMHGTESQKHGPPRTKQPVG